MKNVKRDAEFCFGFLQLGVINCRIHNKFIQYNTAFVRLTTAAIQGPTDRQTDAVTLLTPPQFATYI